MRFENPLTFVHTLKGAPASILWALVFTRKTMTSRELQRWTGYKHDNITAGVQLLIDLGWITARSSRGPWCLAAGRQLPLMADPDPAAIEIEEEIVPGAADPGLSAEKPHIPAEQLHASAIKSHIPVEGPHASAIKSHIPAEGPHIPAEQPHTSAIKSHIDRPSSSSYLINQPELLDGAGSAEKSQFDPRFAEVHSALIQAGIQDPKAGQLARLSHVTLEYARAHIHQATSEGKPLGLAIYRMEHGWKVSIQAAAPKSERPIFRAADHPFPKSGLMSAQTQAEFERVRQRLREKSQEHKWARPRPIRSVLSDVHSSSG